MLPAFPQILSISPSLHKYENGNPSPEVTVVHSVQLLPKKVYECTYPSFINWIIYSINYEQETKARHPKLPPLLPHHSAEAIN